MTWTFDLPAPSGEGPSTPAACRAQFAELARKRRPLLTHDEIARLAATRVTTVTTGSNITLASGITATTTTTNLTIASAVGNDPYPSEPRPPQLHSAECACGFILTIAASSPEEVAIQLEASHACGDYEPPSGSIPGPLQRRTPKGLAKAR